MIGTAGFTAMQMVMELEDRPTSAWAVHLFLSHEAKVEPCKTTDGQDENRLKDRVCRFG